MSSSEIVQLVKIQIVSHPCSCSLPSKLYLLLYWCMSIGINNFTSSRGWFVFSRSQIIFFYTKQKLDFVSLLNMKYQYFFLQISPKFLIGNSTQANTFFSTLDFSFCIKCQKQENLLLNCSLLRCQQVGQNKILIKDLKLKCLNEEND